MQLMQSNQSLEYNVGSCVLNFCEAYHMPSQVSVKSAAGKKRGAAASAPAGCGMPNPHALDPMCQTLFRSTQSVELRAIESSYDVCIHLKQATQPDGTAVRTG